MERMADEGTGAGYTERTGREVLETSEEEKSSKRKVKRPE